MSQQMNSNEYSLRISKSEECCQRQKMRGTQATSALFNWQTLQTVERTNSPLVDAVNSFVRLPSPITFFATCAGVAASCLFVLSAHRSTVLCMCAFAVMYPIPKHAQRVRSWVQRSRWTAHLLQHGMQGLGTAQSCTCMTYTSQLKLKIWEFVRLLSYSFISPLTTWLWDVC